jgi:hypothetical protein
MVALWTFGLVIATLLLWLVARNQLRGISKTTKAEFIKKFSTDFFGDVTREIIMLLDYHGLYYQEKIIKYNQPLDPKIFSYFSIDKTIVDQFELSSDIKKRLCDKAIYTSYEIDDYLLGFFEDIGLFEKKGFLNIHDVYNYFGWYISVAWENDEIRKYISRQRELDDDDLYENYEYIYHKCSSYEEYLSKHKCMFWWNIKSLF